MSETTVFKVIQHNDSAKLRELLDRDPAVVHARDGEGATPLHRAALAGLREPARILIDAGADVSAVDGRFGATPAGWAIEYLRERGGLLAVEIDDAKFAIERGDVEWLERFLKRFPALRTARDESGKSLAELANESGNPGVAALM